MLPDRWDRSLAECSDLVLAQLSEGLAEHTLGETHAAVVELVTGVHPDVAAAVAALAALRRQLALELPLGVVAAYAGTRPLWAAESGSGHSALPAACRVAALPRAPWRYG